MNTEASVPDVDAALQRMSLDELRILAKKLCISGYSSRRKGELITSIESADPKTLRGLLFPNWWAKHHNHVYGAVGVASVILSVAFFIWSQPNEPATDSPTDKGMSSRVVATIEKPIRFADYTAMTPAQRDDLFTARIGEQFVWEGYLSQTLNFDVGAQTGVPFDTDLGIRITPARSSTPQLFAECRFGKLEPTDSGYELVHRLQLVSIGQRLRLSGRFAGSADTPILQDASLEAVFPMDE